MCHLKRIYYDVIFELIYGAADNNVNSCTYILVQKVKLLQHRSLSGIIIIIVFLFLYVALAFCCSDFIGI